MNREDSTIIRTDLEARNLPPVLEPGMAASGWPQRRKELVDMFTREEYGFPPPPPAHVTADILSEQADAWAGKATHRAVSLRFPTPRGEFSFRVDLVLPNVGVPSPLVIHPSFQKYPGGEYVPMEEIVDLGWAVALFCYTDVTEDRDDGFMSGLAGMYCRSGGDRAEWGKIAMWAWAASRVMDHVRMLDCVDSDRIIVAGHSRLGKTALWCAAQDERFAAAVSNNSGASGAAVMRGKQGETVNNITTGFPHWFCANYAKYSSKENEMPFDQHQLLAAMAPRPVYVASAAEDLWADPYSEFLSCVAATGAYELLGLKGLVHRGAAPQPGDCLHDGNIGYHLRAGEHFLSRYDWRQFLQYMDRRLHHKPI